ncbi:MAG TPA: DUF4129 domain-containing protein [Propionibacteriaceae bacterium]|nr:DUF4129 domain-containing protein [Propionibacteriaceae bacterium]
MRSLRSPSAPADGHVARWHGLLLLSALIGALMTVGTSIVLRMLLSPTTALSGHQPGPTLVGYFLVVVAGIWAGRVALKVRDRRHAALLVVGLGVTTSSLWLVVEPHYSMRDVFATMGARPGIPAGSFVLWLWGVGSFVWGARRGLDLSRLRPNSARDTAGGILVIAGVSTLQASFASAQSGLSTASWALPTSVLLAGATLAAAEFERTRELTRSQGFAPPSWGRWARLVAGLGVGAAAVAGISFTLLGRGALQQLGRGLLAAWNALATAFVWALTGIFWLLDKLVTEVAKLFPHGTPDIPPETPRPGPPSGSSTPIPVPEPLIFEIRPWMIWLGVAALLMLLVLVVASMARRDEPLGSDGTEHERSSLLSSSLVAAQLRALWRRRQHRSHHRVDLTTPPADARDAMVHLQELALRHDLARVETESAEDFTHRLATSWAAAAPDLEQLLASYEQARYGEDDPQVDADAVDAWGRVHAVVRERDAADATDHASH